MENVSTKHLSTLPHNCRLRVQAIYDSLKSAERKAVDFILEHAAEVPSLTIVEFANRAGCSEATIVRLAKRLGYEGFPELKADFASVEPEPHTIAGYEGIDKVDSPADVFRKVVQSTIQALHDTMNIIEEEAYGEALDAILKARHLMFSGLGDAGIVALEAHQRFLRLGKHCFASLDPDLQLINASQLAEGDVLVAISHSGRSKPVLDVVKQAQANGATIVAITNFPVSPVAKKADIVLLTAVFTEYLTREVMSKRVTELCIIESLHINCLLAAGSSTVRQFQHSNRVVDINKV